jgi:hypothetical protein
MTTGHPASTPSSGLMTLRAPDVRQQRFAHLVWHFNCHIATMAHPSWLPLEQQTADAPWSRHLLARCGVEHHHDWRLADAASRFWLLDGACLHELLHAVRGVLQRRLLARAVGKARRDELRTQWSPATWHAASDASVPALDVASLALPGDAAQTDRGCARVLRGLLNPSRQAVYQRSRLRLPRDWRDDEPVFLTDTSRTELVNWIAHRWIPQRSAAWAWLF